MLTLNASVFTLIPTPGSGRVLIFEGALVYKPSGTAYAGVAGGEDLDIRYTNASGHKVAELELTGFASVATSQRRWVGAYRDDSDTSSFTPAINRAIVAHISTGEITSGTPDFHFRMFYRVLDVTF